MTFNITAGNPSVATPPDSGSGTEPIVISVTPTPHAVVQSGNATLVTG